MNMPIGCMQAVKSAGLIARILHFLLWIDSNKVAMGWPGRFSDITGLMAMADIVLYPTFPLGQEIGFLTRE